MLVLGTPRLREKSGLGSEEGTGTWVRGWTPGFPDPVLGVARGGGAGGTGKEMPPPYWAPCCRCSEPSGCECLGNQGKAPALWSVSESVCAREAGPLTEREKVSRQGERGSRSLGAPRQAGRRTRQVGVSPREPCAKVAREEVANVESSGPELQALPGLCRLLRVELCPQKRYILVLIPLI